MKAAGAIARRTGRKCWLCRFRTLICPTSRRPQIAAIRKEYRPKIEAGAKELKTLVKEEVDQIRNILSPEQLPKVKAIMEERKEAKEESLAHNIASLKELDLTEAELAKIGEIRNEYRAKFEGAVKQLGGLLSDTQKTAREEAIKADKSRREILQVLNLSSAQRAELGNIAKEFKNLVGNEVAKIQRGAYRWAKGDAPGLESGTQGVGSRSSSPSNSQSQRPESHGATEREPHEYSAGIPAKDSGGRQ